MHPKVDNGILTDVDIGVMLDAYERRFGMASDEFYRRWKAGKLPDTWEFNDWAILVRHVDFSERGDPDEAAAHSVEVFNEMAGLRRRANEAVLND